MNRITKIFQDLERDRRRALMPFITAGDPDLDRSIGLLPTMEAAGASVCEIGIPFSDPIADGPVIQASMTRALDRGLRVSQVFDAVQAVRPQLEMGLVGMVSYSVAHRQGLRRFVSRAAEAGFDALLFPDLPVEEAERARPTVDRSGLALVNLIAPTTPIDRAKRIAAASTGFVYLVARSGITGERDDLPPELAQRVAGLREATQLPIAVGFGISRPEQVREVVRMADGAIVGSALVRRLAEHHEEDRRTLNETLRAFVADLAGGLEGQATPNKAANSGVERERVDSNEFGQ